MGVCRLEAKVKSATMYDRITMDPPRNISTLGGGCLEPQSGRLLSDFMISFSMCLIPCALQSIPVGIW